MTNILLICHGNICRSTMAEFIMKNMVDEHDFYIESAATSREEIGNDIYPPAKEKMREKGVPFEKRKARQMTAADYDRFDYIICMDRENMRGMMRICGADPEVKMHAILDFARESRSVADPWYTGDFNETCQDTVPQALEAFLESADFEDAIRTAISVGGDSDTLAAITGAMAESYYGVPEKLKAKALTYIDDNLLALFEEAEGK